MMFMFNPKYTISQKLLSNIKQIATITSDLNHQKFPGIVLVDLEKSAREISVYSSTSIEGNPLPLTEVKRILKNLPQNARDSEKEVLNYNSILIKLNKSIGSLKLTDKLVLDIQKGITKGLIDKFRCGSFREEPVFVNNPKTHKPIYLPPDHKDVKKLMNELVDFVNKNEGKVDPLILAGLFHKQFVIIHPFVDGNGRTARLATKLLLAKMGLNTFNLFSFENYYNQNVSKYFQKVGVLGNYYEIKQEIDFTDWLEYFTDGVIDELLRVQKGLQKESVSPKTKLEQHHKKILSCIEKNGYITDSDYSKLTKRAKATRSLDFNKLIELDFIKREGKGKNTYYKMKK
ncbi:hypothetical protein COW94_00095 [Candidatus Peregrinibacteria bacterium CG22_combo_CG10-13_8_21_14_all_44_10]|nr:MAG: hypothetical protein AUK45_05220 [Candidatus Peregrinibacteria bacterium CG2_30_44_17]PIP66760.1 MAG: hypothetical protein COW94_00095 [Candidatus Peregrinibacteria bacterium CG22_combo_CG10-13_8_21_14_all_44_10]PJB88708.1 MAG: hypothetical protein CO082_03660 [Candidatus Peregrinibacteria bacterium CG_4_9_14_0_8_um_filter_44_15]